MNSFSWFLYFADVSISVDALCFVIGCSGVICSVVFGILFVIEYDQEKKPFIVAFIVSCLLLMISAIIPSKDTLYAIAASELGEQAYKSEIGQKASKAIEIWIDSQLIKK